MEIKMKNKRIMIVHSIAWSHYAALTFSELYKILNLEGNNLLVIHIAKSNLNRKGIGDYDSSIHKYPHKILYDGFYEHFRLSDEIMILNKELISYKPDILIVSGLSDVGILSAIVINKILKSKNIVVSDTTYVDRKRFKYKEILKSKILKLFDGAFCVGTAQKEYMLKLGMKEENIFIASYYAVDNEFIYDKYIKSYESRLSIKRISKLKENNFIYSGRMLESKNPALLIRAFNSIKQREERSKSWGIIIVGDGPQKDELKALVKKLDLEKDVFFAGGKSWREVPEYYAIGDVLVLPSISEAWGLVVNEAMVCGLPVIVSKRAGSYWDLVKEGENGFGFDPYNREELEQIMLKFIKTEVDRKKMGEISKKIIEDYSPKNMAMKMYEGIKYFC